MVGSRSTMSASLRLLGRAFDALELTQRGRPALVAVSLAGVATDVRLLGRLRNPRWWPGWSEWLLDGLVSGVRAAVAGDDHQELSPTLVAGVVPTSIMSTWQHAAGDVAVPVPPSPVQWPPRSATELANTLGRIAAPTLSSVTGMAVGRALHGDRPPWRDLVLMGAASSSLTFFAVRYRDRLHRASRQQWSERTAYQIDLEQRSAQVNARTAPTPGHEFAKTLVALGMLGSSEAAGAGRAAMGEPARLLADNPDGVVLRQVIGGLPVEPSDGARLWIPRDQVDPLREQMRAAEEHAVDGADQTVHVLGVTATETRLRWLGRELTVRTDPPPLSVRLYPTMPALAISAHYKAVPMVTGAPAAVVAPSALVDLVLAWRFRRPPDDRELRLLLGASAASTAAALALLTSSRVPRTNALGRRQVHQTSALTGFLLLIATHWSRLSTAQRTLLPLGAATWALTVRAQGALSWTRWASEACFLAMPIIATWEMTERLDDEAGLLQRSLIAEFDRQVESARAAAEENLLDLYAAELQLARRALDDMGDDVPEDLRAHLVGDCDALEAWLAAERGAFSETAPM